MHYWVRRVRGAIGMGFTWAVAWGVGGGLLARISPVNPDLPFALLFAPIGFLSGIAFSGVLVALVNRYGVSRLSLSRFALWGAVSGLLLSGAFVVGATLLHTTVVGGTLLFTSALAISSATCAAGSLALARQAEQRALRADTGQPMVRGDSAGTAPPQS